MMRIALLAWESKHSIAVGGLAEHVTELAAALHRKGHDVHVFTRPGPQQSAYVCVDGVHYHSCPSEPHPDFLVDNDRMCQSFVWHLAETESYLNAPFDVVHGHDWLAVRAMTRVKNVHQRPVVMTIHSTEYGRCGNQLHDGISRTIREIEWEGTYVAERIICVSGALRSEVQNLYGVPADKIHVVYNGIDVSRFDARIDTRSARGRYAIAKDDPLVLFAGRMTRQKGPDLLVEALPGLLVDYPRAKFVFAGDGDLRGGLEQRAAALGIASATRFLGHRHGHELVGLFKSADLVCVPSRNEPFGIVILEAWSARKPVVATRNGGPAEFVKHGDTGLTVSDDRDAIGWGVGTVLADRTNGRRLGRNGRREAEARFSWDTIAAATERVYESCLSSRFGQQKASDHRLEEVSGMARERSNKVDGRTTKTRQPKGKTATTNAKSTSKTAKPAGTTAAKANKSTRTSVARSAKASRPRAKTAPTTGRSTPSMMVGVGLELTHDEISRRAYEIYLARGRTPGDPMEDWLQAERDLRRLRAAQAAGRA